MGKHLLLLIFPVNSKFGGQFWSLIHKRLVLFDFNARNEVNLLVGRAFVYHLYPFISFELKDRFNLDEALQWELLPQIYELGTHEEKYDFLKTMQRLQPLVGIEISELTTQLSEPIPKD